MRAEGQIPPEREDPAHHQQASDEKSCPVVKREAVPVDDAEDHHTEQAGEAHHAVEPVLPRIAPGRRPDAHLRPDDRHDHRRAVQQDGREHDPEDQLLHRPDAPPSVYHRPGWDWLTTRRESTYGRPYGDR